jgi:hypothetical protein
MAAVKATLAKHGLVPLSKSAITATKTRGQQKPTKPKSATAGWRSKARSNDLRTPYYFSLLLAAVFSGNAVNACQSTHERSLPQNQDRSNKTTSMVAPDYVVCHRAAENIN